ncbi:hypothetical protein PV10_04462 [Exophiala mesophila]|uniref:Uncharacterized protein n=1 Tax=Exophiala mesophila TaxID=212818 RepID=A0A0D1ZER9_EXOME|nr:uncharacterized protein PV10_04462 [Exophiala mesophila]KIV93232.1 hypothetical protein PV10_04462 [Exophiala mesophila]
MADTVTYSKFACVGTGFSGIGLGATLRRWYNESDIRYFERRDKLGGTWYINKYPGAACDVPSAFYSLSYEQNTEWSRILPTTDEIEAYLQRVAQKYDLLSKMTFGVEVTECRWVEAQNRWRLTIRDDRHNKILVHEASILFSASGQLVYPLDLDVPGVETFKGGIFHSARWRKDIGRSKHWVFPPIDFPYPRWLKWAFKHVPFILRLHRFHIFLQAESQFKLFPLTEKAGRLRAAMRVQVQRYMRETAPEKYHDILIPDFDVGCKRRIFDSGYLKSLHASNLVLTNKKAIESVPDGVRTEEKTIKTDVIILANGFRTNDFVSPLKVIGRDGELLTEHWEKAGGPEAYNCSVMSGFPNFFLLLGPNAATGHTSAIMASENSINYALRFLKPVITGKAATVEIKADAEIAYTNKMQDDLSKTVWNSGCQSWYIKEDQGQRWNAMSYPYSQAHFWYRSVLPTWKDWKIKNSSRDTYCQLYLFLAILGASCLTAVLTKV